VNILNVNDLNVYYGGIHAIKNISFQIKILHVVCFSLKYSAKVIYSFWGEQMEGRFLIAFQDKEIILNL